MKILFLGDIVGNSGCIAVKKNLSKIIKKNQIDFVIVNGENAAKEGVGITENIVNELLSCGNAMCTWGHRFTDFVGMMCDGFPGWMLRATHRNLSFFRSVVSLSIIKTR